MDLSDKLIKYVGTEEAREVKRPNSESGGEREDRNEELQLIP